MRVLRQFDPWRSPYCPCPPKYTLNPYTGCYHGCRYCYITSYIKDGFKARLKDRLIANLRADLAKVRFPITIAISYSSDPYTPPEGYIGIMRRVLKLLMNYNVRLLIATKSTLIKRDLDLISQFNTAVSITITTLDRYISKKLEPNVPSPSARLKVIEYICQLGIPVSLRIDPIFPGLTDDYKLIEELICTAKEIGVKHIVSSIYKVKPDNYRRMIETFPHLRHFWYKLYWVDGEYVHGYRYAPYKVRYEILSSVASLARKYGLQFNTCREGLTMLDTKNAFCDASHMLKS